MIKDSVSLKRKRAFTKLKAGIGIFRASSLIKPKPDYNQLNEDI